MPASFRQTTTTGDGDLATALGEYGGFATRAVNAHMEQAMRKVQKEAIARAPLEHGNLEGAIKLENEQGRQLWAVFVDMTMSDDTGKYTVGDYAVRMHEESYVPGPISQAKGPNVGRKYLENPFREIVDQKLLDELRDLMRNPGRDSSGRFTTDG